MIEHNTKKMPYFLMPKSVHIIVLVILAMILALTTNSYTVNVFHRKTYNF